VKHAFSHREVQIFKHALERLHSRVGNGENVKVDNIPLTKDEIGKLYGFTKASTAYQKTIFDVNNSSPPMGDEPDRDISGAERTAKKEILRLMRKTLHTEGEFPTSLLDVPKDLLSRYVWREIRSIQSTNPGEIAEILMERLSISAGELAIAATALNKELGGAS
jgi:hypothetical protein